MCALIGLLMSSGDVSGTFLYSDLLENVYIQLPDGRYARLKKSIYGLKQAAHNWFQLFQNIAVNRVKMKVSSFDSCMYYRREGDTVQSLMIAHVDDHLQGTDSVEEKNRIFNELRGKFRVEETTNKNQYLGMNILLKPD